MKALKKVAKIIIDFLTILVFLLLIIIIFAKVNTMFSESGYFQLFKYSVFNVASGSMEPTIKKGDVILIKKTKDYEVDDIVTFYSDGDYITHRIVYKKGVYYVTKGDANNTKDVAISEKDIIGEVIKIYPNAGIWQKVFTSPSIIIMVFVTLILFDFAFSYKGFKKEKPEQIVEKPKEIKLEQKEEVYIHKEELKEEKNELIEKKPKEDLTRDDAFADKTRDDAFKDRTRKEEPNEEKHELANVKAKEDKSKQKKEKTKEKKKIFKKKDVLKKGKVFIKEKFFKKKEKVIEVKQVKNVSSDWDSYFKFGNPKFREEMFKKWDGYFKFGNPDYKKEEVVDINFVDNKKEESKIEVKVTEKPKKDLTKDDAFKDLNRKEEVKEEIPAMQEEVFSAETEDDSFEVETNQEFEFEERVNEEDDDFDGYVINDSDWENPSTEKTTKKKESKKEVKKTKDTKKDKKVKKVKEEKPKVKLIEKEEIEEEFVDDNHDSELDYTVRLDLNELQKRINQIMNGDVDDK